MVDGNTDDSAPGGSLNEDNRRLDPLERQRHSIANALPASIAKLNIIDYATIWCSIFGVFARYEYDVIYLQNTLIS
jgi:hypothetical protein